MERRKFFGILPLGLIGIAATAKGQEPKPEIKKAETLVITGPNGEKYHPLVVRVDDEQHESVSMPQKNEFLVKGDVRIIP